MEPVHPRFSLNQITTPRWSVPKLVAACKRHLLSRAANRFNACMVAPEALRWGPSARL